jgi:hypothetical protein
MLKQLCWLPMAGSNGEKVLHLRTQLGEGWRPYTACPEYKVPDYKVPGGSKGWATYQKLLRAGWTLVPTAQAQRVSPLLERLRSA